MAEKLSNFFFNSIKAFVADWGGLTDIQDKLSTFKTTVACSVSKWWQYVYMNYLSITTYGSKSYSITERTNSLSLVISQIPWNKTNHSGLLNGQKLQWKQWNESNKTDSVLSSSLVMWKHCTRPVTTHPMNHTKKTLLTCQTRKGCH